MPLFNPVATPWYIATSALMATQPSAPITLVTNTTYLHDVYVPTYCVVTSATIAHGGVSAGNLDLGIYTQAGTLLCNCGSTAAGAINSSQSINFTAATLLAPGRYYLALWVSNSTDTYYTVSETNVATSPAYGSLLISTGTNAGGLAANFAGMGGTSTFFRGIPFLVHIQGSGF